MIVKDKVAIVTGASSGIGLATARLFTQRGARVALVARSVDKLIELSRELPNSFVAPADMSQEKDIKKMVGEVLKHYGRVDVLVNCAGQGYDAPLEYIDIVKYRRLFELDVVGPLVAMQAVIPAMRKQGGGTIVNISSGASLMNLPNMSPYSSVKRALNALTITAREELQEDNIVVSVVYPYMTLSAFEERTITDGPDTQYEEGGDSALRPPDSAEFMAERVLEAVTTGQSEQFAHEWMKGLR